jgi:hypothetical protein
MHAVALGPLDRADYGALANSAKAISATIGSAGKHRQKSAPRARRRRIFGPGWTSTVKRIAPS